MGNRRKARELALQVLFQIDVAHQRLTDVLSHFLKENALSDELQEFTLVLVEGTLRNIREIDEVLEGTSTNWKLSRMSLVDRALLRLSTFELLYLKDIPSSVSINEAVEIAKKYGTEESSSFINGILDKISKEKEEV